MSSWAADMEEDDCFICGSKVADELTCSDCKHRVHYKCGMGIQNPVQKFRVSVSKAEYVCPVCVIGVDYKLIHRALQRHELQTSRVISDITDPVATNVAVRGGDGGDVDGDGDAAPDSQPIPANQQHAAQVNEEVANASDSGPNGSDTPVNPNQQHCAEGYNFKELCDADISRGKKFTYILNSLRSLPHHANTIICGDSNFHGIDGKEVDSENDQVRVRSVGGLCIVSAVQALIRHRYSHRHVKSLVWALGTNDAWHPHQHHADEREKYLSALYKESQRIFPNATVSFISPFRGLKDITNIYLHDLERDLKEACPRVKRFQAPSMRNKVGTGLRHINSEGKKVLLKFLQSKFVRFKARVFSGESGRKRQTSDDGRADYSDAIQPRARVFSGESGRKRQTSDDMRADYSHAIQPRADYSQATLPRAEQSRSVNTPVSSGYRDCTSSTTVHDQRRYSPTNLINELAEALQLVSNRRELEYRHSRPTHYY